MIKLKNEKLGTLISGKMYTNDKNNSFYKSIFIFRLQSKYKVDAGSGEKCKLSLQLNAARSGPMNGNLQIMFLEYYVNLARLLTFCHLVGFPLGAITLLLRILRSEIIPGLCILNSQL